jgi:replicative superfamily II helicase
MKLTDSCAGFSKLRIQRIYYRFKLRLKTAAMARYLVEVSHSADKVECLRSIQIFLSTGSHFLTNADWGCLDGEHKAWFIMEVDSKDEALRIVPSFYWKDTKITLLNKFKLKEVEELLRQHTV